MGQLLRKIDQSELYVNQNFYRKVDHKVLKKTITLLLVVNYVIFRTCQQEN
jgi:hypothetical protein